MAAQATVLSFLLDAGWGDEVAPWGRAQLWKLPAYGPREAQAIPLCKKPACSQKGLAVAGTSSLWVESVQQGAE